jgi:hypothetical protein
MNSSVTLKEAAPILGGVMAVVAAAGAIVYYGWTGIGGAQGSPVQHSVIYLTAATTVLFISTIVLAVLFARSKPAVSAAEQARDNAIATTAEANKKFLSALRQMNDILALDYSYCTYLSQLDGDFSVNDVHDRFDRYIEKFLTHTAELLKDYTGGSCAACIKVFSSSATTRVQIDPGAERPPSGATVVFTLGRDELSRRERDRVDHETSPLHVYPYTGNAAFFYITHREEYDGYYHGNGLGQKSQDEYWNANPRWRESYDAVAVASLKNPANKAVEQALGFLCIDNKVGGFDRDHCREILECLASVAYYSIRKTTTALNQHTGTRVA